MFRQPSWHCLALVFVPILFAASARADDPAVPAADKDAQRQAIQNALAKKIDWDFGETPLVEVAEKLRDELKIPVLLDRKALADVSVTGETPITFKMSGITAKSAVRLLLQQLYLRTMIRNEVLLITTPDMAENHLLTATYDVTDLVVTESGEPDFDSLIDMITRTIKPTSWDGVGGTGSVQPFQSVGIRALVVSQSDEVHEQIAQVLADLRALRRPANVSKKPDVSPTATPLERHAPLKLSEAEKASRAAEEKIRAALKKTVNWDFSALPLADVVRSLEKELHITMHLDARSLSDLGVETGVPVTFKASGVSAMAALELLLRDLSLAVTVRDEVVLITSQAVADENLLTRTYDVSDLSAYRTATGEIVLDFDGLIDAVTQTICPTTWDGVGGTGSIRPVEGGGVQALVVNQTWQIQERIAELLDNLGKLRK
jgi:hypothetical protein